MQKHSASPRPARPRGALGFLASILAVLPLWPGCTSSPPSGSTGGSTCERNAALIAAASACRRDDDCPCGAHCTLGVCGADCTRAADCPDGGRCDLFGRCRAAGDPARIAAFAPPARAGIVLATPLLRATAPAAERTLRFRLDAQAPATVRVAVDDGLEVACASGATFGRECALADAAPGTELTVQVRTTGTLPDGGLGVRVYAGDGLATATVTDEPVGGHEPVPTDSLAAGRYEGAATLAAVGLPDDASAPTLAPPAPLEVPLTAEVHLGGGGGIITLAESLEPMRLLIPPQTERWIGALTKSGATAGTVDFPTLDFLAGDTLAGAPVQILLDAPPAAWTSAGESLHFELVTRFTGVLLGAPDPTLRWTVHLTRTGDLPAGAAAPSVPADAVFGPGMTAARGVDRFRFEAAVAAAVVPPGTDLALFSAADKRELLATFGRTGDAGTLAACALSGAAAGELAAFAFTDAWKNVPEWGSELRPPSDFMVAGPLLARLTTPFARTARLTTSAELVPSGGFGPRDLPCEVTFALAPATFPAPAACGLEEFTYDLGHIDLCDAMAAAYGCAVADTSGETLAAVASVTFEDTAAGGAPCTQSLAEVTIPGDVQRVCRLPITPAACAELAFCWDGPPGATRDTVRAPYVVAADPLDVSGDLRCAAGTRSLAWDVDENAELPAGDPARLTVQAIFDACERDYARVAGDPPAGARDYGDRLSELVGSSGCVDGARLLFALAAAADPARQRAQTPTAPVIPLADAYFNRLVQRLLDQHGLVAREAAEAERMADLMRRSGEVDVPPEVAEVLDRSLAAWNLLLHPRLASALAMLSAEVLVDPDYRPRATGTDLPTAVAQDQVLALPVTIARTLDSQLALVAADLETAALRRDRTALVRASRVPRYALVLFPFLADQYARAEAFVAARGLPSPVWFGAYDAANGAVTRALASIQTSAHAIAQGLNPLGIEENDLPLYFFGDEEGPNGRFVAISDFLIGEGPADVGMWVPALVNRAEALFDEARAHFLERRDREIQVRMSESALAAELDGLRRQYGELICNYCWRDDLACADILDEWPDFDPNTCFIRYTEPICQVDREAFEGRLRAEQVRFRMCLVGELRRRLGSAVGFAAADLNAIADNFDACDIAYPSACPEGGSRCTSCTLGGTTWQGEVSVDLLRNVSGVAGAPSRVAEDATNACLDRRPDLDPSLPSLDDLPDSPVTLHECYTGAIGEAMLELRAATQDVLSAQSQMGEFEEKYDLKVESCILLEVANDQQMAARTAHAATMRSLRKAKLAADTVATALGAIKDCFSAGAGAEKMSPFSWAFWGIACGAGAGAAASTISSAFISNRMDEAQQAYDNFLALIGADAAEAQCFKEAEMELVGIKTAALGIERAGLDVETARYNLVELKSSAQTYYDEGLAAMAAARARYVKPLTHDLWLDETIDAFLRAMRLARRALYLAVRAVEYESQQTLSERDAVLTAATPEDLDRILEGLWTTAASRGVGGNRPTELKAVVSLRRHLLQLADTSAQPAGWQALGDVERFRLLLQDPRYATFDAAGNFLGQRIPFELAPLAAIHLGAVQGIPVLAASDCAERVWSVNASILGTGPLYRGDSPTFTRLELRKANTFYSQWCDAPAGGPAFQVASVRPSRNLFRDPRYGTEVGADVFGAGAAADAETSARIEAYFNVPREAFESDDYANGETTELAARGLYGAYALFIPAEVLSLEGGDGLVLNAVDDILLRFDYVSVAR